MMNRKIHKIIPSQKVNMGGHLLEQPLPNRFIDQLDPFLLIHHAEWKLKGNQSQQEVGIGGHPHRGFSPVTFVFQGDVRHQDSTGNDAVVSAGGTQWMHAGGGIIHSERPSAALAQKGGMQEIIQFWVNTPAKYKMEPPFYLPLSEDDTPFIEGEDFKIHIVAGEYQNITGPVTTFSSMLIIRGIIQSDGKVELETSSNFNTLMYLLDGNAIVNGKKARGKDLIWFENEGTKIKLMALETTRFIILSGEPINEQVSSYGPFVMNTQAEIIQAMQDAQTGKMGVLTENF